MKIAIVGANGFIGRALVNRLSGACYKVYAYTREVGESTCTPDFIHISAPDLGPRAEWKFRPENDIEVLIHAAARVHVVHETSEDPMAEFRKVNVEGTLNLARQAAGAGIKRFVFLSSVKVNGGWTTAGHPFTVKDLPTPEGPYGVSKYEAEQVLLQIATETGMEVVIIRPPLVYGPGVGANFRSMMRWLVSGIPLPLAGVESNRRSLVALDNLVDLVETCLDHPAAANATFLVSDGEDLSTADLLRRMGVALGKPARLFRAPEGLLKTAASVLHRPGIYHRLCGSLQVDISATRQLLGWSPPITVDEGLRRAAEGFHS